jgi:hypothetical protein
MDNEILFSECQQFKQWWIWLILIALGLFTLYEIYQQISSGDTFGYNPTNDPGFLIGAAITFVIALLLLVMRLDTQIKRNGVYVRFFPIQLYFRHYSWDKILKCYVRKYKPLAEFGGWGLRFGVSGKAYNISGNKGLQLELTNNKKLLIGTQKPEELSEALNKIGKLIQ